MALIGLPTVASLTTLEMAPEQYREFRKRWISHYAEQMIVEGGVSAQVAVLTAKNDFALEEKRGDKAFEERNNAIRRNRSIRAKGRHVAAGK